MIKQALQTGKKLFVFYQTHLIYKKYTNTGLFYDQLLLISTPRVYYEISNRP